MLVPNSFFDSDLAQKYFMTNNMIALKITNECPLACAHCRENSSMDNKGVVSKEVIDTIIKQIVDGGDADKWVVCLQGGDPLLYPDICKYVIDECRKHKIATNVYTSGWWWKEHKKYVPMILDWKPTIVTISVNDWTIEKNNCGLQYVDTIAEYFQSDDTPILLYSEVNLDGAKWGQQCKYKTCTIAYELAKVGRAKNLVGTYKAQGKMERWMGTSICVLSGFEIGVDGTIYPNCCAASGGPCRFGNVLNGDNVSKLRRINRMSMRCKIPS